MALTLITLAHTDEATWLGRVYAGDALASPSASATGAAAALGVSVVAGTQTFARLDDGPGPFPRRAVVPPATPSEPPATPAQSTPTAAALAPALVATPVPPLQATTCPATYLCYPRLGISGPIVPYTDCTGSTDVGTAIRAYSCLSSNYLMGHAYTQMGKITGWQAGDVVYAYGRRFTVYSALTEQSCQPPIFPLAPLSMQTSLSPNTCGPVLVVQAR